ncbi:MarR family winged helix-turn-helix transcriptional regulator [Leifsonia sp. NPDC058230]|uniref:MarR family winged helix-turn-helix transcriptional regulator n=1 Tax=Leifsonia sp. NPDC058230 TaxID=3346391 RepID=UPI0036DA078B
MARPGQDRLDTSGSIDLSPVIDADPLDLRVSLASIVHWADSDEVRRRLMDAIDFPVDDMAMFLIVNQLSYRGAMRPSDLALVLGTGRANLTKIAHRLTEHGLAVRAPAPGDDRGVLIALTPAGRELGERIMETNRRSLASVFAAWSDDDLATLRQMLARLARDAAWDLRGKP